MTPTVLALALGAAFLHAGWNVLLAGARDVECATAVTVLLSVVAFAPVAILTWETEPVVYAYAIPSAGLELAYMALLAYAYRTTELSVVYPVARGVAPVVVLAVAAVALGEGTSFGEAVGVLLVAAGVLLVRGLRTPASRGAALGLLIAVVIAAYTLVDSRGIEHANAFAYLELILAPAGVAYAAALARVRGFGALRAELGRRTVVAAAAAYLAYLLVLLALRLGDAAPVSAVRESSVVIAVGLAAIVLGERVGRGRAAGAVIVAAGVAVLAFS